MKVLIFLGPPAAEPPLLPADTDGVDGDGDAMAMAGVTTAGVAAVASDGGVAVGAEAACRRQASVRLTTARPLPLSWYPSILP